jgi:hypothetical protein
MLRAAEPDVEGVFDTSRKGKAKAEERRMKR